MFSIIVLIDKNNGIGYKNKLLYKIPKDLKRFKSLTLNHTLIMGNNTYKSLPKNLPSRNHIILSHKDSFIKKNNGFFIKTEKDINNLLKKYKDSKEEIFIIGGASIYKLFLPYTNKMYITQIINKEKKADSYFPCINYNLYKKTYKSEMFITNDNIQYNFINYEKIK